MGKETGIAWTRSSWNPWIGCTEVSPGCDNCYARELDKYRKWGGTTHWGAGVPRHRTSFESWRQPDRWNRLCDTERKTGKIVIQDTGKWDKPGFWPVFPSLCDPFDNEVPDEWRQDFFDLIYFTPNLTWLLLTKRIGNVGRMLGDVGRLLPNVWIGASIVHQEEAYRDLNKLLAVPAAIHFVSYEPALGPVNFEPWLKPIKVVSPDPHGRDRAIDQIIVGGESNQGVHKARPFDIEWARSTLRQCRAAGTAFFMKQMGSERYDSACVHLPADVMFYKNRAGADPAEWPEDLRVQEWPETNRVPHG